MIRKLIIFLLMLPLFVLWLELHVLVNNLLLNLESPLDFVISMSLAFFIKNSFRHTIRIERFVQERSSYYDFSFYFYRQEESKCEVLALFFIPS